MTGRVEMLFSAMTSTAIATSSSQLMVFTDVRAMDSTVI